MRAMAGLEAKVTAKMMFSADGPTAAMMIM